MAFARRRRQMISTRDLVEKPHWISSRTDPINKRIEIRAQTASEEWAD